MNKKFRDMALVDDNQPLMPTIDDSQAVGLQGEKSELISVIFGLNPQTNLPDSDSTKYLSDAYNPDIAEFIKRNLMTDVSSAANHLNTDGLSDDDILQFQRQTGESRTDYLQRINRFVTETNQYVRYALQEQQQEKESD